MAFVDIEPIGHNSKDKHDVIDWDGVPNYTCDLNYRLPFDNCVSSVWAYLRVILVTGLAAVVCRIFLEFGFADTVANEASFTAVAIVAGLVFCSPLHGRGAPLRQRCGLSLSVFAIWSVLAFVAYFKTAGATTLAFFVAGPLCIGYLADQIATHHLHWASANPLIDRATMTSWREDWRNRWSDFPDRAMSNPNLGATERSIFVATLRLQRLYPVGFLVMTATIFGMIVFSIVVVNDPSGRIGALILLSSAVGFAAISVAYCVLMPEACRVYLNALGHYFDYGIPRTPPWAFQSPSGGRITRRVKVIVIAAILVTLCSSLALKSPASVDHSASPQRTLAMFAGYFVILPIASSAVLLTLGAFVVAGPTMVGHHRALDAAHAIEQHDDWTSFDGYVHRLQHSRNSIERRSNIIGVHSVWSYPILVDTELNFEHQHVLGPTGVGKTALSLTTDLIQNIHRNDGPVIVVDCKGDRALFETAQREAKRSGRKFKWFTNKPFRSTYIFNPLAHLNDPQFTLPEILGVILQSLNLHHGDEYARAFFGKEQRTLLHDAYEATMAELKSRRGHTQGRKFRLDTKIESFWDLDDALKELAANSKQYEAAKHLIMIVQSLCDFEQLSLTASRDPNESAIQHAISMPEAIEEKQVLYFYLVGSLDVASVGELARLVLFAANAAAIKYRDRTNKKPRLHFIADEAQCLVAKNIETVLQQARDAGIAFTLAHQSLSQLQLAGGVDLTQQVLNSTCVKRYHAARDPYSQKYISDISGTTTYYSRKWKQFKRRVHQGNVSSRYACTDADHVMRIDIAEQLGPRLETEDIRDINRDINKSIVMIERNAGYSQFHGAFPMTTQWPMSKQEHTERSRAIWPEREGETISIGGAWPADDNDETIVVASHSDLDIETDPASLDESLRRMREKLTGEGDIGAS